jgi:hypothetical protein
MLHCVALVRTDVSEVRISIIRVKIDEIRATLAVSSALSPMMEAIYSTETSTLTRATRRNFPEDAILQF